MLLGDGRLRPGRGRGHHRRHQPARHPRPGPAAARAASTARSWCPCPTSRSGCPILQVHCKGKRIGPDVDLELVARGTPGHERRRPGQPGQRGRPARRAPGQRHHRTWPTSSRPGTGCSWASAARAWSCPTTRRSGWPTTRAATPCWPTCSRTPTRCTRSPSCPPAWPWASPSSCPSRSATSTPASTSRTRCACAWAAGWPSCSSTATCPPAPPTTWSGNTELARKMVREWGMSEEIGPMAWGSQGQVFLGEDLMHTRDYSEDTCRVIDDEVERILREQEERAIEVLTRHRGGLDAVARALLEQETHRRRRRWAAWSTRPTAARCTRTGPRRSPTSTATATATAPTGRQRQRLGRRPAGAEAGHAVRAGGPRPPRRRAPSPVPRPPARWQPSQATGPMPSPQPPQHPQPPRPARAAAAPAVAAAAAARTGRRPAGHRRARRPTRARRANPGRHPGRRRPAPGSGPAGAERLSPGAPPAWPPPRARPAGDQVLHGRQRAAGRHQGSVPAAASWAPSTTVKAPGGDAARRRRRPGRLAPPAVSAETVTVTVAGPGVLQGQGRRRRPRSRRVWPGGPATAATQARTAPWSTPAADRRPPCPTGGRPAGGGDCTSRSTTTPGPPVAGDRSGVVAVGRDAAGPAGGRACQVESAGASLWTKGATGPGRQLHPDGDPLGGRGRVEDRRTR